MLENIEEKILETIKQNPQGLTITDISRRLNLHRNTVSKYVFALARAGIIEQRRIGKVALCSLKKQKKGFFLGKKSIAKLSLAILALMIILIFLFHYTIPIKGSVDKIFNFTELNGYRLEIELEKQKFFTNELVKISGFFGLTDKTPLENQSLSLTLISSDSITNQIISTDLNGTFSLSFNLNQGNYTLIASSGELEASLSFEVLEIPFTITLEKSMFKANETVSIFVKGEANKEFTLEIFGQESIENFTLVTNEKGEYIFNKTFPPGNYSARILSNEVSFEVLEEKEEMKLELISKEFYYLDENITLIVSGTPDQNFDLSVLKEGLPVFSFSGQTNSSGLSEIYFKLFEKGNYSAILKYEEKEEVVSFEVLGIEENITEENVTEEILTRNITLTVVSIEQGKAEINKPVKWKKVLRVINPTEKEVEVDFDLELPENSFNITLEEKENKTKLEGKRLKDKLKPKESKEYILTYYTEAPHAYEEVLDKYKKIVKVNSSLHYENVLAYTEIEKSPRNSVRLYWLVNSERINVTFNESFKVKLLDLDKDELIERVEWIIPYLSEQVFEISIVILNPYTYLRDGETWTVAFNTTGKADLIISSPNANWKEMLKDDEKTFDEMEFLDLKCGENSLKSSLQLIDKLNNTYDYSQLKEEDSIRVKKFLIKDYSCDKTGYFINKMFRAGYAVLEFDFDEEKAYAYDPSPCQVNVSSCSDLDQPNTYYCLNQSILDSTSTACINISANNVTLDCQGNTIDGQDTSSTYGINISRSSSQLTNITVKNCIVTDWTYGIYLRNATNNTFINNTANSNSYGFFLYSSSNYNTFINNSANSNSYGFSLYSSSYNTFLNNTAISNTYYGFVFYSSSNNTLINNTAISNTYGLYIGSSSNNTLINNKIISYHNSSHQQQGLIIIIEGYISHFYHNISESNLINDKPILYQDSYYKPCSNNTIFTNGSSYSFMGFINCFNITVKDSSPSESILLAGTTNSTISNISISYSQYPFCLFSSNYVTLTNIVAFNNSQGIYLQSSAYNLIKDSIFSLNQYGVYLYSSSNNFIYNNLFNNTYSVYFSSAGTNYWNTTRQEGERIYSLGNEIGGNYWTNSTGNGYSDTCSDSDKDGFCDEPYTLAENNIDYLPLSDEYQDRAPFYSLNSTSSTRAGTAVSHNLFWKDDVGLSHAIFSFDNCTGEFKNISTISLSGKQAWSNFTVTINETVGCTIKWKVYANDTSNNWNESEVFSYTTKPAFCDVFVSSCSNLNQPNTYYCLEKTIYGSYMCINVSANNITLDCLGFTIGGGGGISVGIYVSRSSPQNTNITIKNCIVNNWYYGIELNNANNNTLINNTGNFNYFADFRLYSSSYNILINNSINSNTYYGISLESSSNNFIYNNLFNNTYSVYFSSAGTNYWNTTRQEGERIYSLGNEIGGNYWTNSTGNGYSDTCSDSDKDGFCDEPYTLAENNIDYLPLSDEYQDRAPFYSLNSTNSTLAGSAVKHSLKWNDDVGLSGYIFSFCNGSWSNFTIKTKYYNTSLGASIVKAYGVSADAQYVTVTSYKNFGSATNPTFAETFGAPPYNFTQLGYTRISASDNAYANLTSSGTNYEPFGIYNFTIQEDKSTINWIYIELEQSEATAGSTETGEYCYYGVANWSASNWFQFGTYVNGQTDTKRTYNFSTPELINQFLDRNNVLSMINWGAEMDANEGCRIDFVQVIVNYNETYDCSDPNAILTNDTWVPFSGNPKSAWSNITKIITSEVGKTIKWCVYANDTSNNWNYTSCLNPFSYVTEIDTQSPFYSLNSTNSTIAGSAVSHNLFWQDNYGLSHAIFSFDNCTGEFKNISTISLSGKQAWSNFTVTINETVGCTIKWKVYANDTSNNWNESEVFSYTTRHAFCDVFISSCQELDQPNTYYCLNQSIINSSSTTCMSISANNITLDCLGNTIDGQDTSDTYGINISRSSSQATNITVKNCIVTDWYYGIYLYQSQNNTLTNNTANSNSDIGFFLDSSSYNTLINNTANSNSYYGFYLFRIFPTVPPSDYNILIDNTANSNSYYGFYLDSSSNNTLINNTANSNSDIGFFLFSSSNNTFINNTANSNYDGIFLQSSFNNSIVGGSIASNSNYDYRLRLAGLTNNFTQTNFTQPRTIYFEDSSSWFNYRNVSDGVWLKTSVSAASNITRELINWTKDWVEWNDTSEYDVNITYYLTNLYAFTGYDVFVNNNKSLVLFTGSYGEASTNISFSIGRETKNIRIIKNVTLHAPEYSQASVNTTLAGYVANFTMKWNDTAGLSHYKFSFDNCTGSFVDDAWQAWPGNPTEAWVSIEKRLNYTLGCTIRWKVTANNTQGISRESEIYSFKTSDIPKYNNLGQNKTSNIQVGDAIKFYANWSDFDFLDTSIFSINASGSWENVSFYKFISTYTTFSDGSNSKNISFYIAGYDNTTAAIKLPIGNKVDIAKMNVSGINLTVGEVSNVSNHGQTSLNYQRKTFYANGSYWAFWEYGGCMYYNASSDGYTWSSGSQVVCDPNLYDTQFSVWTNGTHVFYARTLFQSGGGNNLTFRIGQISGNTINWQPEVTVLQGVNGRYRNFPFVSVSSDGYPWIGYSDDDGTASLWYPYVIRALDKNGMSWDTPFKLSTIDTVWGVSVLPLSGGKMYIVYTGGEDPSYYTVRGRLWNGSMQSEEIASSSNISGYGYEAHSAVADGDNVHVTFKSSSGIIYINRTTSGWSPETFLLSGSRPTLSINKTSGEVHLFSLYGGTTYYCKRTTYWQPCLKILELSAADFTTFYDSSMKLGLLLEASGVKFVYNLSAHFPSNVTIKVGNQDPEDWSFSSTLDETNSPKRIDLNTTKLTAILVSCNCIGCSVSGSDCIVPIRVSTNTEGKINLDDLYILTFTQAGWSNFTQVVQQSWYGKTIGWKIYTNDSVGYWNVTQTYTFLVDSTPPTYSLNSTNSTIAGTAVMHSLFWQDNLGLSHAIFSFDNCTGEFKNISTITLTGTQSWSNFTVTINETIGCTIRWKVYANDSNNNWNESEVFSYTTRHPYCDVFISSCQELNQANTYYCLNQSVSSSATCFNILANNITLDCQGYTINYSQSTTGYAVNNTDGYHNITIKNCNIFQGNSTPSYSYAIYGSGMNNSYIYNNTIITSGSYGHGIYLYSSSNNNITNNNITTSGSYGHGIYLLLSSNNTLTNNRMNTSQTNSLVVYGTSSSHFNHSIDNSNLAEGLPIYYCFNCSNTVIENQDYSNTYGQIIFAWSTNVTINNITASNDGFNFFNVTYSKIIDSTINTSKGYGIFLYSSSAYNNIYNNTITTSGSFGHGIHLYSNNNNLTNNTITTSGSYSYGIRLYSSSNNNITNNNITTSNTYGYGIYLYSSSNNNITNNNITTSNTYGYGIYLSSSSNNNITNNNIITSSSTSAHAIYIYSSSSNIITGGSYIAKGGDSYDYFLRNASTNNNFTQTNFTASRRIYFYDTTSWFNYNNRTDIELWLKTNVSSSATITRKLISWTQSLMQWNESASSAITARYNITGLNPNKYYLIYNNSVLTYTLKTDSSGSLPSFTIYLSGESEIKVQEDTQSPQIQFTPPTDPNAYHANRNWSYVNVSITDDLNTSAFIDWNYSLVGYWSFDWYNSTGVFDNSTYNNFGTFQGGLGTSNITAGKYGYGLEFSNLSLDYISVPDNPSLDITEYLTIELWIKLNSIGHTQFLVEKGLNDYDNYGFHICAGDELSFEYRNVTNGYNHYSTQEGLQINLQPNIWYHVAVVFNKTHVKLYCNGSEVFIKEANGDLATNDNNLLIGKQNIGVSPAYFNGTMDEVRIWNRALTPEEINSSYNAGLYRLYRNFTNLTEGTYEYYAYAIDNNGNTNKTETRTLSVDLTAPQYSLNSTNSTIAGTAVSHNLYWQDNVGLSGYIFSFDNCTGSFVNDTFVSFSGTGNWSNVTKVINSTVGCTIRWKVYANDTSNNWNESETFSYTTRHAYCDVFISSCQELNQPNTYYCLNQNVFNESTCFEIKADNITLDCQGYTINYSQSSTGHAINITNYNYTTIKNCNIYQANSTLANSYGIYLRKSSHAEVINNTIQTSGKSSYGIFLYTDSINNNITNNKIITSNTFAYGMRIVDNSNNNIIEKNNITTTGYGAIDILVESTASNQFLNNTLNITDEAVEGIVIGSCYNLTFKDNKINATLNAFHIKGDSVDHYNHTIDDSNLADGLPILYSFNNSSLVFKDQDYSNTYGQIIFSWSNNITIENVSMSNDGITLYFVNKSKIVGINLTTSKGRSVFLYKSHENNITYSYIDNGCNYCYDIILSYSNSNLIANNNLKSSGTKGSILLEASDFNYAFNNTINTTGTFGFGFWLYGSSSYNNLTNNTIETFGYGARGIGICGESSNCNFNTVENSFITTHGERSQGIEFKSSDENKIINTKITVDDQIASSIYVSGTSNYTNYLINSSFNQSNVGFDSGTTDNIAIQWYLDVYVNDTAGYPINKANVSAFMNNGSLAFNVPTASTGYIQRQILTEYTQNSSQIYPENVTYYTNYTINVSKNYYHNQSRQLNLTSSRLEVFTLESSLEGCDVLIENSTIPYTISLSNKVYCLIENVGWPGLNGIKFQSGVQNTTLDCRDYSIGSNDSPDTSAINLTNSSTNNNTIKNCNITDFYYGLSLINTLNNTVKDSVLTSNYFGLYLYSVNNSLITNCTLNSNDYGIYLDSSFFNNISYGSIASSPTYDYSLSSSSGPNYFRQMNFTEERKIYVDEESSFLYSDANEIWLKTSLFFPPIFEDGFESGDYSAWTGTYVSDGATLQVSNEKTYKGNYSSKIVSQDTQAAYSYKDFITESKTIYTRFCVYVKSVSLCHNCYLTFGGLRDDEGFLMVLVGLVGQFEENKIEVHYMNSSDWIQGATSATTMPIKEWHCFEIMRREDDYGEIRVWLDDNELTDLHIIDLNTTDHASRVVAGQSYSWSPPEDHINISFYIDDVSVSSKYIN